MIINCLYVLHGALVLLPSHSPIFLLTFLCIVRFFVILDINLLSVMDINIFFHTFARLFCLWYLNNDKYLLCNTVEFSKIIKLRFC